MGTLRIASLNAASLIEPGWDDRRHETVAWIDRLEPDIVCLQETWQSPDSPNSAEWVAEHCASDWHVAFGGLPFPEPLWPDPTLLFGSSVLSRSPIDHQELIPLPVDEHPPPPSPPSS
jgi:endonuclease/exonuclease/phosphatase family metal-dependent hydrolase